MGPYPEYCLGLEYKLSKSHQAQQGAGELILWGEAEILLLLRGCGCTS